MKKSFFFALVAFIIGTLSGCMYPKEELTQNQIPYQEQMETVQSAVNQFREDNGGILPIKTKEGSTPIYQKYQVEFKKIVPLYIAEIPGNAFESGGVFQYVLVNVESDPTVKLLDIRLSETIREIKMRIRSIGFPPYKERIADNVYSLDFQKLGYKEDPVAISPYSQKNLPFIVDGNGEVYVDYRIDLFEKLQKTELTHEEGDDIRELLLSDSFFVPAFSLPYTIDPLSKEPIFLAK
jgi:hypothetical protein